MGFNKPRVQNFPPTPQVGPIFLIFLQPDSISMTPPSNRMQNRHRIRGPLKAYCLPPASMESMSLEDKENNGVANGTRRYRGDSESSLASSLSLFSEKSSLNTSKTSSTEMLHSPVLIKSQCASENGFQFHLPRVAGVKRRIHEFENKAAAFSKDDLPCACCCASPTTSIKRPHVAMGAGGLRALRGLSDVYKPAPSIVSTSSIRRLDPVCPVPMLPTMPTFPSPSVRCIETQTSPPLEETERLSRSRSKRGSGAMFMNSIRKTFGSIRRSLSSDRSKVQKPNSPAPLRRRESVVQTGTTCSLLQKFPDGSRMIQLRRSSTNEPFGLFIKSDSKGLYVSRLESIEYLEGQEILQVGDRVLTVQGVPAKCLDNTGVRSLLGGCQLALFKVKSVSK